MEPILKLEHIQKYYGNEGNITKAIRDISFSVEAGEFLGIMGASGSGKTTLLNCISTIDTVSAGHIYLGGTDVTEIKPKAIARFRRENLGFVFQDFNLLVLSNGLRVTLWHPTAFFAFLADKQNKSILTLDIRALLLISSG